MKRTFSLVLALILVLGLVGLAQASLPFKIGLITGTVSQGEEEYRAAEKMVARYPGSIEHVTYPDNFMQEQETVIAQIVRFAMDPEVKAIVVCQAVPGTTAAFNQIRDFRDDIQLIMGLPHEDPDMIAGVVDFAMETDQLRRGPRIARLAAEMGAKKILHYSFPRHMSMELLAQRYNAMKEEAEKLGLEVIDVTAPDPMGDAGIPGTQQFILEDIPRQAAQHGLDIAFFGTNCAMMEPAIRATLDAGIIFPEQCCPSPYHGYPGALGIEVPPEHAGDIDYILEQISLKVAEKGRTGRMATWQAPINMVFVEAGIELAIRHIQEGLDWSDVEVVEQAMFEAVGLNISVERYTEGKNFYLLVADSIIF
ncbi:MAG TPA: DUF3798 domain-containing protein [Firmicutes bacterium]|nr:DUF3798 domain-containing protein [Bacillota bacterium]